MLEWVFLVILYTDSGIERQTYSFKTEEACERARSRLVRNFSDALQAGQGFVVKDCELLRVDG